MYNCKRSRICQFVSHSWPPLSSFLNCYAITNYENNNYGFKTRWNPVMQLYSKRNSNYSCHAPSFWVQRINFDPFTQFFMTPTSSCKTNCAKVLSVRFYNQSRHPHITWQQLLEHPQTCKQRDRCHYGRRFAIKNKLRFTSEDQRNWTRHWGW